MFIIQYPSPDIGNSFCLVVRMFGSGPKGPQFYPAVTVDVKKRHSLNYVCRSVNAIDLKSDELQAWNVGRGGLAVRSRRRYRRAAVSKPIPPKIRRVWGLLHAKLYIVAKRPAVGVARKLGEEVPAQMPPPSSNCGSK
ncbi:hypothetical protein AVEN_252974-1 [Araneus ventricosus]|uniref:Uncharacterized protein n=1 Tax=Araneus ventricosus TaxID=182803 RepID=A0A4Y2T111_ARAVE|nr:hypothetical protein AVEN_252974-1 [Araneus ventricosus]